MKPPARTHRGAYVGEHARGLVRVLEGVPEVHEIVLAGGRRIFGTSDGRVVTALAGPFQRRGRRIDAVGVPAERAQRVEQLSAATPDVQRAPAALESGDGVPVHALADVEQEP